MNFSNFEIQNPWWLLLFLIFIPLLWRDKKKSIKKGVLLPSTSSVKNDTTILPIIFILKLTKYLVLSALIIAIARPRSFTISENRDETKGVDIILTVDVSLSMLSRDLEPDRLTAVQKIAKKFVNKRPNDRIGLVIYSGEAISKVPITTDHQVVLEELEQLNPQILNQGTAIGEGLTVAINHLKNSKAKSKIIILMTDGVNTLEDAMNPQIAADIAADLGIKVYSIGIGTNGYALMPTQQDLFGDLIFTEVPVTIDEPTLKNMAYTTGGKYFRATSNDKLEEVYEDINKLEKSNLKTNKFYNYKEYFREFLWFGFFILMLDAFLRWFLFKILR